MDEDLTQYDRHRSSISPAALRVLQECFAEPDPAIDDSDDGEDATYQSSTVSILRGLLAEAASDGTAADLVVLSDLVAMAEDWDAQ